MDVLDVGWGFDSLDWMKRDDPIAEIACQYVAPTMKNSAPQTEPRTLTTLAS